jgi:hypothetical protein
VRREPTEVAVVLARFRLLLAGVALASCGPSGLPVSPPPAEAVSSSARPAGALRPPPPSEAAPPPTGAPSHASASASAWAVSVAPSASARPAEPSSALTSAGPSPNRHLIPGRHVPSALAHPARPTRLVPGVYACKVDDMYRLRTCHVEVDAEDGGRTWLEVDRDNLLPMRGVLEEDHGVLVFEGFPTEAQPFGCYACDGVCRGGRTNCACTEAQLLGEKTCLEQVLRIRFTGAPGAYRGKMTHDTYFQTVNDDAERSPNAFDVSVNRYNVTLGRKLPDTAPMPIAD